MLEENKTEVIGKETENLKDKLQAFYCFPTAVYNIQKPEFLEDAKAACKKAVEKQKKEGKKLDEIYPVYMTENLYGYKGMDKLAEYIGQTSWNILSEQGYAMNSLNTTFTEFWCQEHHKHSAMDQHVHGHGSQIVGFYFVDTPKDCSRIVFHDPRNAKVQINLPEVNLANATAASNMINFEPKEGLLMFTNAWLAHSFTRHASNKPIRFIHFNLTVQQTTTAQTCTAPAEVV
jgi:uncharacterized protein (TIGR02466 family)